MNIYENNIDAFLELILIERYSCMKIERTFKYKKPKYTITIPTSVDYLPSSGFTGMSFSFGTVGVYVQFIPHRNEIILAREDYDSVIIESEKLTNKYSSVIESLYHQKMNESVVDFIDSSVDYLELKKEFRDIKIKAIVNEKE